MPHSAPPNPHATAEAPRPDAHARFYRVFHVFLVSAVPFNHVKSQHTRLL